MPNYYGPYTSQDVANSYGYNSSSFSSPSSGGGFNSWDSLIGGIAQLGSAAFNFGSNYVAATNNQQPTYGNQPVVVTPPNNNPTNNAPGLSTATIVAIVVLILIILAAVFFFASQSNSEV